MVILWERHKYFGMVVPFKRLFKKPSGVTVISTLPGERVLTRGINKIFRSILRLCCSKYIGQEESELLSAKAVNEINNSFPNDKIVVLDTGSPIIWHNTLSILHPIKKVKDKVTDLQQQLGWDEAIIGVHVRRTDNMSSTEMSPLYLFEEKIRAELRQNSNARFYLATDDCSIKDKLRNEFGTCILTYDPEQAERFTNDGEINAYVELLLLSSCKELWGSYWSSYSDMAAQLGQIKKTTIKIDNN